MRLVARYARAGGKKRSTLLQRRHHLAEPRLSRDGELDPMLDKNCASSWGMRNNNSNLTNLKRTPAPQGMRC
jgi:hypothetical protein